MNITFIMLITLKVFIYFFKSLEWEGIVLA